GCPQVQSLRLGSFASRFSCSSRLLVSYPRTGEKSAPRLSDMTWSCQEIPKIGGIRGMTGLDAGAVSSDSEPDVAHSRCWIGGRSGTDTRLAAEGLCKAYQQRNHHGIDQTAEWRRRAHDRFQIDAGDPNSRIERPT